MRTWGLSHAGSTRGIIGKLGGRDISEKRVSAIYKDVCCRHEVGGYARGVQTTLEGLGGDACSCAGNV